MANLIWFGKQVSLEEYVVVNVCANYGVHTRVTTEVLRDILETCGVTCKKSATKEKMIYQLYEHYQEWSIVAKKLGVGVHINQYISAFPFCDKADIKRLEKFEVLKVVGYQEFRMYGKLRYGSLYDVIQFINMTEEQMQAYLKEYPKGKRKTRSEEKGREII